MLRRRARIGKNHENLDTVRVGSDSDTDSEDEVGTQKLPKRLKMVPVGLKNDTNEKRAMDRLEDLVFGGEEELTQAITGQNDSTQSVKLKKKKKEKLERKPAWEDEDDDNIVVGAEKIKQPFKRKEDANEKQLKGKQYKQALKSKFEKVTGTPAWASLDPKEDSDAETEDYETRQLLQSTGNYLAKSVSLPREILGVERCPNANKEAQSKGQLRCVEFHPTAQVLLAAGLDNTLNLFQVDGKINPKIQNISIKKFPIFSAHFTTDGREVILSSTYRSFYYYDMMSGKIVNVPKIKGLEENGLRYHILSPDGRFITFLGKYGRIHLLSAETKEWIDTLKMNGSVESLAYSSDGSKLFSFGDDGEVYVWDMHTRSCVHRFVDDGCTKGLCIAASPNNQYIACGQHSGVVNIYNQDCLTQKRPTPLKALLNLTTPCTSVKFNSTSEMLAMASNYEEHAFRLVHFPSMTVFSNFPDRFSDRIRLPYSMDFSLNSGYMTIGNQRGCALLYRLKHYKNY